MKLFDFFVLTTTAFSLSSCAVGSITSATAGVSVFSIKSSTADNLTPEGEHKLIKRIKDQFVMPQKNIDVRDDVEA